MPTPARRATSAIEMSAAGSAKAARAAVRILSRLRAAAARLVGNEICSCAIDLLHSRAPHNAAACGGPGARPCAQAVGPQVDSLSDIALSLADRLSVNL